MDSSPLYSFFSLPRSKAYGLRSKIGDSESSAREKWSRGKDQRKCGKLMDIQDCLSLSLSFPFRVRHSIIPLGIQTRSLSEVCRPIWRALKTVLGRGKEKRLFLARGACRSLHVCGTERKKRLVAYAPHCDLKGEKMQKKSSHVRFRPFPLFFCSSYIWTACSNWTFVLHETFVPRKLNEC